LRLRIAIDSGNGQLAISPRPSPSAADQFRMAKILIANCSQKKTPLKRCFS
jgi:hypothetical protein